MSAPSSISKGQAPRFCLGAAASPRSARLALWITLLLCGVAACSKQAPERPLKIAAAADLARAFEEVGGEFEKTGAQKPVFTFGSTGLLAKQLMQGAPFDVFAAANISFIDEVLSADQGWIDWRGEAKVEPAGARLQPRLVWNWATLELGMQAELPKLGVMSMDR
jgi:hypothetical protein